MKELLAVSIGIVAGIVGSLFGVWAVWMVFFDWWVR